MEALPVTGGHPPVGRRDVHRAGGRHLRRGRCAHALPAAARAHAATERGARHVTRTMPVSYRCIVHVTTVGCRPLIVTIARMSQDLMAWVLPYSVALCGFAVVFTTLYASVEESPFSSLTDAAAWLFYVTRTISSSLLSPPPSSPLHHPSPHALPHMAGSSTPPSAPSRPPTSTWACNLWWPTSSLRRGSSSPRS